MKKPTISVEIPEYLQAAVNKLVRYYSEGWRAGYLEGFTKMGAAIIRPVGAIGGQKPQNVKVEQANVEPVISELVIHTDFEQGVPEPEKPKLSKRKKTAKTEPPIEEMRKELVREFVTENPAIDCLSGVKKTRRGCRL